MSLTENIAIKIGRKSKMLLNADDDKEQVIIYGAIILLQTIYSILSVVVVGYIFEVVYEALIFSIVANILRKYSGGVHASSPGRCIVIGTIPPIISAIAINKLFYSITNTKLSILSAVCLIISFIVVYKNAPVDSVKKPISNTEIKKRFKKNSIIVIFVFSLATIILLIIKSYLSLNYITTIESIVFGLLWQSTTLTKYGISIHNKFDFVLKYIMERRWYK